MFRALRHRNFRLFWTGALLSNVGSWMQIIAQGWLVLEITNSPYWLGLDAFAATAPGAVLTLVGGVFADLISRKSLLIYTQLGAGLAALVLASVVYAGTVQVWMILVASFVTGCCMSLASPSYQAITIDLVGREDLPNAIALNSAQFQLSRVVGPALAGVTITAFGLAGCFFANGLSYIAVVASLIMVHIPAVVKIVDDGVGKPSLWQNLLEGFRYVRAHERLSMALLTCAVVSLFSAPYISMMAVFARDVHKLGEAGLSLMMGTAGMGALVGALLLTALGNFRKKAQLILWGGLAFGFCTIGFALASDLIVAIALLFGMGMTLTVCIATTNTLLQQLVTDEMRGRVLSMFVFTFYGTSPVGNYFAGVAAERYGAPRTLAVCGACVIVFILLMAVYSRRLWKRS